MSDSIIAHLFFYKKIQTSRGVGKLVQSTSGYLFMAFEIPFK